MILEEICELLKSLEEDGTLPRDLRVLCENLRKILNDSEKDLAIRVNHVAIALDEICENPDLPTYARTKIWSIVSRLEQLKG